MLKNLTFKKKNQLILIASPVLFIMLYYFVFSNTVGLVVDNLRLKEEIKEAAGAKGQLGAYKAKLENIDLKLRNYTIDSVKNREYIFHVVGQFCVANNLTLKDFPTLPEEVHDGYKIETNKIIIEGGFLDLLKILYEIEKVTEAGRPASVVFEKKEDRKRKREVLELIIYLQNLKKDG
ncbi:hypothetical protein RCC89_05105 [Cytophagaceae bacterium ABcell3]|nr:hypothetical protein RCC89_05105 [Cytophagaceae bacterium ABcell3]